MNRNKSLKMKVIELTLNCKKIKSRYVNRIFNWSNCFNKDSNPNLRK